MAKLSDELPFAVEIVCRGCGAVALSGVARDDSSARGFVVVSCHKCSPTQARESERRLAQREAED